MKKILGLLIGLILAGCTGSEGGKSSSQGANASTSNGFYRYKILIPDSVGLTNEDLTEGVKIVLEKPLGYVNCQPQKVGQNSSPRMIGSLGNKVVFLTEYDVFGHYTNIKHQFEVYEKQGSQLVRLLLPQSQVEIGGLFALNQFPYFDQTYTDEVNGNIYFTISLDQTIGSSHQYLGKILKFNVNSNTYSVINTQTGSNFPFRGGHAAQGPKKAVLLQGVPHITYIDAGNNTYLMNLNTGSVRMFPESFYNTGEITLSDSGKIMGAKNNKIMYFDPQTLLKISENFNSNLNVVRLIKKIGNVWVVNNYNSGVIITYSNDSLSSGGNGVAITNANGQAIYFDDQNVYIEGIFNSQRSMHKIDVSGSYLSPVVTANSYSFELYNFLTQKVLVDGMLIGAIRHQGNWGDLRVEGFNTSNLSFQELEGNLAEIFNVVEPVNNLTLQAIYSANFSKGKNKYKGNVLVSAYEGGELAGQLPPENTFINHVENRSHQNGLSYGVDDIYINWPKIFTLNSSCGMEGQGKGLVIQN